MKGTAQEWEGCAGTRRGTGRGRQPGRGTRSVSTTILLTQRHRCVRSRSCSPCNRRLQGDGGISGGENFAGKISPSRKVANPPPPGTPPAKFSRHVTNNFTANSDAGKSCEFRHVQRCAGRREGTKTCLSATRSGCVTGIHWKEEEPSRTYQETTASCRIPGGGEIFPFRKFPLATSPPPYETPAGMCTRPGESTLGIASEDGCRALVAQPNSRPHAWGSSHPRAHLWECHWRAHPRCGMVHNEPSVRRVTALGPMQRHPDATCGHDTKRHSTTQNSTDDPAQGRAAQHKAARNGAARRETAPRGRTCTREGGGGVP